MISIRGHKWVRILMTMSIALASLLCGQTSPESQEYGDPVRGAIQVQRVCSACHGVARGEASRHADAPNLNEIAVIIGMSETALNVTLLTSHRKMPNLILTSQERSDVIAFILALKLPGR